MTADRAVRDDVHLGHNVGAGRIPGDRENTSPANTDTDSRKLDLEYLARVAAKLVEHVDDSAGRDACWPWTGGLTPDGYGRLYIGDLDLQAHRCALEVVLGRRLAPGEVARHKVCDNRVCCNGAHLLPGTIADNNRDKVEHGRAPRGLQNGNAKLSDTQVAEIQALGATPAWGAFSALARKFGVSVRQISYIAKGERRRAA